MLMQSLVLYPIYLRDISGPRNPFLRGKSLLSFRCGVAVRKRCQKLHKRTLLLAIRFTFQGSFTSHCVCRWLGPPTNTEAAQLGLGDALQKHFHVGCLVCSSHKPTLERSELSALWRKRRCTLRESNLANQVIGKRLSLPDSTGSQVALVDRGMAPRFGGRKKEGVLTSRIRG